MSSPSRKDEGAGEMGAGEKQQVAMRQSVLLVGESHMSVTENNRDSPLMTAELWLALSVQEFVKNYLENSVTTVLAFIVRATLAV